MEHKEQFGKWENRGRKTTRAKVLKQISCWGKNYYN
ncbi:hypothetical protein M5D96_002214 [Drosophila gunungcola]|uniref:Uncharacterized protein n=1 Tax=Drosophila gunungcola TaxID=103775 RepID=A0A9P9YZL6_9MUSC|nr:hypothetical protein M5D96_002214 [Drosophila gunungcola]